MHCEQVGGHDFIYIATHNSIIGKKANYSRTTRIVQINNVEL